jgi:hypothetical protein
MLPEARRIQRALTVELLAKRRLNAPAIWLKPESATANPDDAVQESHKLNTALDDWASPNDDRNMAVRLVDGFVELQIVSPDDVWVRHFFQACASLRVDARFAYGTRGKPIASVILQADQPERWGDRWPRGHKDKAGQWVETKIAFSTAATKTAKPVFVNSRPLPGSTFAGDLVQWRPAGKPAADDGELGLEDLEARELATTSMELICRAVAFATLAYWITVYLDGLTEWDQSLTRTLGGWIARQVREGRDINARGKSLEGVCWAPVDSSDTADALLTFLGKLGAERDLRVAFDHADSALERNQPVPGWPSLESLFGPVARIGIRRAFRAGLDIDAVEEMSERYIYDHSTQEYLDRKRLLEGHRAFEHKHDHLIERHATEIVYANGKPHNPFKLYATSSLRTDVDHREFRPGHEPGGILRYSRVYGLLKPDDERRGDEFRLFNTFSDFAIKPIATVDPAIMRSAVTMLDRMLALLTQDNAAQMKWLKQFIAWIAQHPEVKPQVCPIIVGGQGIGKSLFGENLMEALFGNMAGTADAASLSDNKFLVTPFIGKLITFIDEVKLENQSAVNIIKKLIRSSRISGQMKFGHQRDWFIPSRIIIASNSPEIGLTAADSADRAFFFIVSYTAENKGLNDNQFKEWANSLKPFYAEFVDAIESVSFRQHLMRYFKDFEVTRIELENLEHSSRGDESVVRAVMSDARRVGRGIVANARVAQNNDITAWFNAYYLRHAIKRIDGERSRVEPHEILEDWKSSGVLEKQRGDWWRFKYKYGTLLEKLGEAHGLKLPGDWDPGPGDWGDNDVISSEGGTNNWRGNKKEQQSGWQRRDSDHMPDF